jgi:transcriptional regulator with XRE-family HTH domain
MTRATTPSGFGKHVRSLRRARGITQQDVAERSGLSADTIRRLEHEEFSPSLNTLQCLVDALGIRLSTLFLGYELDDTANVREIVDMLRGRSASDVMLVWRLVRHILRELDAYRSAADAANVSPRSHHGGRAG